LLLSSREVPARQTVEPFQVGKEAEDEIGFSFQVSPLPLSDAQVFPYRELGEDGAVFRHVADPQGSDLVCLTPMDCIAGEQDLSAPGGCEAEDGFEGRCLPGPIAAQDSGDAALWNCQGDPLENVELANEGVDVLYFQILSVCHALHLPQVGPLYPLVGGDLGGRAFC